MLRKIVSAAAVYGPLVLLTLWLVINVLDTAVQRPGTSHAAMADMRAH
jgi:hypothetical protein